MSFVPPLSDAAKGRVALPFAIVTLLWGSTWLVIRGQLGEVPVSWSVCYRFLTAAITMFIVALFTRTSLRLTLRQHGLLTVMGICIFCLNFNFVYRAEAHVTSGIVAVVFALLLVYNALLGRLFLGQPLSRPFLAGSAVAMAGIGLLFEHELRASPHSPHETALGVGFVLLALLFASISNVMQSTERMRAIPMPAMLAWGMTWGALANALVAYATFGPPRILLTPIYLGGVLYLGVLASALAFTLYFNMIRLIGPARGGYVNVLTPVLAMVLSTIFEHYRWSVEAVLGGVLVIAGLVVAMRARSPAR
ncbi:drug/metabolite transporter (DMT)-like permease [Sphingomonas vulcanisoli]|uniref:Drug/metabolite transporter (DMT)-like permease n=1 Tax=Sphingomonas vulcanisoli TaxID=1658060 RepID=A0ABX0TT85_9SPHN|nr:drug/metabolite transporter (DMT)-like permease [Sphingomonas vulcanisoli]